MFWISTRDGKRVTSYSKNKIKNINIITINN